jgi:hypothetical protein
MIKRFSFLALAAVLALAFSVPAYASSVPVTSDSGGGSVNVTGTSGGATVATISTASDNIINTVNGTVVQFPTSSSFTITGSGSTITGGSGSTDIGSAVINFTILSTPGTYFVGNSHLNFDGTITSVTGTPVYMGYNFANLVGGGLSYSIDKFGVNFAGVLGNSSAAEVKNAGFGIQQQATIPEPASMALLGIGMTGLFALRRLFKRRAGA